MLGVIEKGLMFMLSVNINENARDFPKPGGCHRLVVDAADASGRHDFL